MFEGTIADGVFQLTAPAVRWLSTGFEGGYWAADAAYNVSIREGWDREELDEYVTDRQDRAGFETPGPTLLTGVDLAHARGARLDSVVVYATAGLSNPAALPMNGSDGERPTSGSPVSGDTGPAGTVNLLVGTTRPLTDGALATLVATAVEAKTATLLSRTGFPGTTTDAVITGAPTTGDRERWAGSGTELGNAVRVCVRDAVRASLESRYANRDLAATVEDADYGVVTAGDAEVFEP